MNETSSSQKILYLPVGVRDHEEPRLEPYLMSGSPGYTGVAVPFNLFHYVYVADSIASEYGKEPSRVRGIIATANNLVRKLGIEGTRRAMEEDSFESDDHREFVEDSLKREEIRASVFSAVCVVLSLDNVDRDAFLTGDAMKNDKDFRDRILSSVSDLQDRGNKDLIEFFGGPRVLIEDALKMALPSHKRKMDDGEYPKRLDDELNYVRTEAALMREIGVHQGNVWLAHLGNDRVQTGGGKRTIVACLREVAVQALSVPNGRSILNHRLDGCGFHVSSSGLIEGGNPAALAPYYLRPENRYLQTKPLNEPTPPLVVPAIPWHRGWVAQNMRDIQSGGLDKTGQASAVIRQTMNPVLRHFVRTAIPNGDLRKILEKEFGRPKLSELAKWAYDDDEQQLIPASPDFEISDYNDAVRALCEEVAKRALTSISFVSAAFKPVTVSSDSSEEE